MKNSIKIDSFNFKPNQRILEDYKIVAQLGGGWEAEVYRIRELKTGVERAAKFFFPHRDKNQKMSTIYAKKLHRLKDCPVVIKYHHRRVMKLKGNSVTVVISDFIEGQMLSAYLASVPGKRLSLFQAVHLLYALTLGLESIHAAGEYHGDLHTDNSLLEKIGLSYQLKLLDLFHWGDSKKENRVEDIYKLIQIFYEIIGGKKYYSKQPQVAKEICCGLRRSTILKKFKTITALRVYIETISWT